MTQEIGIHAATVSDARHYRVSVRNDWYHVSTQPHGDMPTLIFAFYLRGDMPTLIFAFYLRGDMPTLPSTSL